MNYEGLVVLNYQLVRKLGEGGFGSVYLAEQKQLERQAAIKILHPQFARNEEVVERFFREARAVCAIGHDSIIGVQNLGRLETGEPFYVMEYFDGMALSDYIDQVGPLPLETIVDVFAPVVNALAAAHEKGIVHRDLKPQNIIIRERDGQVEEVKLLDFGIAKLVEAQDSVTTQTGFPMGSPMYMSPEQARDSKHVDVRADVYSLAASVFQAIAGRPPFVHKNSTDLLVAVQTQPAPPLRLHAPHASVRLENVIGLCLSKEPEQRPASIQLAWALMREALLAEPALSAGVTAQPSARSVPQRLLARTMLRCREQRPVARGWVYTMLAAAVLTMFASARVAAGLEGGAERAAVALEVELDAPPSPVSRIQLTPTESVNALAFAESESPEPAARAARRERPRRVRRTPVRARTRSSHRVAEQNDTERAEQRRSVDCSASSFARVCRAKGLDERRIHAALRRLKRCRGRLDRSQYKTIQSLLVSKL